MPRKFYKFRLLLDENMPPRQRFPRLNSRYDVKHVRDDLHKTGIKDPLVYDLARELNRLLITFNGDDFNPTATLLEHTLQTQGFMDTLKTVFPRRLRPQYRDSTWANLVNALK